MTTQPFISIILPCYNSEKTLNRCIDSILSQTFQDFELILVDDGSTDSTGDTCDQFAKNNNRIVAIHKINGGVSSARNEGLKIAKGDYVTFCDSDDLVKPDWLKSFAKMADDIDFAAQGMETISQDGTSYLQTIKTHGRISNKELTSELMMACILGYTFIKLFRRSIIEDNNLRFDENLRFKEDDTFVFQYLKYAKKCSSTSDANYIYYAPSVNKDYGTSTAESTLPIIQALHDLFDGDIPHNLLIRRAKCVKDTLVCNIINKDKLHPLLLHYYRKAYANNGNLKSRVANAIILNAEKYPRLTRWILKKKHGSR